MIRCGTWHLRCAVGARRAHAHDSAGPSVATRDELADGGLVFLDVDGTRPGLPGIRHRQSHSLLKRLRFRRLQIGPLPWPLRRESRFCRRVRRRGPVPVVYKP